MEMNKKLVMPVVAVMLMVAFVSAVVIYQSINVDITVEEALSAVPIDVTVAGSYPGETISQDITIHNNANVPLYTTLEFIEGTNDNGVTYSTGGALSGVQTIGADGDTVLTVTWTIDEDSNTGNFLGVINLTRVAESI
jgi:hypothetical protein